MKRLAEDELVVGIPDVVGVVVIAVEPLVIVIVLHVEQLKVAIGVGIV